MLRLTRRTKLLYFAVIAKIHYPNRTCDHSMTNKIALTLLSAPTIIGMVLLSPLIRLEGAMAQSNTNEVTKNKDRFCVVSHSRLICSKSSTIAYNDKSSTKLTRSQAIAQLRDPDAVMNFSDEESDAAAALFGCDCPACLRSLRQMRFLARVS
jgi:hypothetical protein